MSEYLFGFVGSGNMAGALARAAVKQVPAEKIILSNRTRAKAEALAAELGCAVGSNEEVAGKSKYIFLGVKPQMMAGLLESLRPVLRGREDRYLLVSMAAGLTLTKLEALAGLPCPIIRIMPNTPCAVGAGMTTYTANAAVTEEELAEFLKGMSAAGTLDRIEERLMDAASAVAGCGGAFIWQVLEALADGGVACGLPRDKALLYAAKMIEGTGRLTLQTGLHPGVLKDQVCSPGGSTIAGVRVMEERGVRGAMMDAVIAAERRTKELGQ